jgi:hypothetical protein
MESSSAVRDPPLDPVVLAALEAIEQRDWARLEPLLHPYLHWTDANGRLRGRTNVLAYLAGIPHVPAPGSSELRDGQIYRWTAGGS